MNELIQQTGVILTQAREWLKLCGVKETVTGFLGWMSKKVFSRSKIEFENLIHTTQHDRLLPMLMNGQVRVWGDGQF
jgi:hypothetical protein